MNLFKIKKIKIEKKRMQLQLFLVQHSQFEQLIIQKGNN